ncbi:MAG: alpha/beta fold hydrolase [Acidimicrobiia bacterium]|nr:alpha/beta fold hydrolase [Acidimicrobiia bacterium]
MATDWTFNGTWPYEPKWFESADGRMHYVDEGPRSGKPVVMAHGNPTWAYLYRNFIGPVSAAGYRAIVPDHLGFGRSDKPDQPELYTIQRHADRFEALLESLDLQDATVVCQDWGGPISLNWATRHPDRVRSLFILNTFAHRPPTEVKLPLPLQLFRTRGVGEAMVKGLHMFVRMVLFRAGVVHRERMTADVKKAYLSPHRTYKSRTPILVFPREIPAGPEGGVSDLNAAIERGLRDNFRDKPVKLMWAMKDIAFTPEMVDNLWLRTFPDAEVIRIDDAGHYLQEDAHERIVPELVDFLGR